MPKEANEGKSGTQTILQRCQRSKDAREAIDIDSNIDYENLYIQDLQALLLKYWERLYLLKQWYGGTVGFKYFVGIGEHFHSFHADRRGGPQAATHYSQTQDLKVFNPDFNGKTSMVTVRQSEQ